MTAMTSLQTFAVVRQEAVPVTGGCMQCLDRDCQNELKIILGGCLDAGITAGPDAEMIPGQIGKAVWGLDAQAPQPCKAQAELRPLASA